MKHLSPQLLGLSLLLLSACSQSPRLNLVPNASTQNDRTHRDIASAYVFSAEDCEGGGLETFFIQNQNKQPKTQTELFYIAFYAYECDGSYVVAEYEAFGSSVEEATFSIDKNLKMASLTADFELTSCKLISSNEICLPAGNAEVTVTWTGVGDASPTLNYLFHTRLEGVKRTIRGHGTRREATASVRVHYGTETIEFDSTTSDEAQVALFSGRYSEHIVEQGKPSALRSQR